MQLASTWALRNTLASALEQTLDRVTQELLAASHEERIEFIDGFMPNRSPPPEWTASFERLVELIWLTLPADVVAAIHKEYANRPGPMWKPVAEKFAVAQGERLGAQIWQPTGARRPAIVLR